MRAFASDNYAGAHPAVLDAVVRANADHAVAYGDDPWTARARELLREHFGARADSWLVFNGTAANVLALGALCGPGDAVVCSTASHLHVDEAGAPERMTGVKLLCVPTRDGKLRPEDLPPLLVRRGDEHAAQPRVVSIANATELGTVYAPDEVRALADAAHGLGMLLHVDGARLANAAVSAGADLAGVSTAAGADAVSFGATKLGALGAEVVVFPSGSPPAFAWRRKQNAQLASKMRFPAAQIVALLEDDLWRRLADHANAMARRLAAAVRELPGVEVTQPVEANAVFARLPREAADEVRKAFAFHTWDERTGEVRWMCSWDTTEDDVRGFVVALRGALGVIEDAPDVVIDPCVIVHRPGDEGSGYRTEETR